MYCVFINASVIRHMTPSFFSFLQVHFFPYMWEYGHNFFIKYVDEGHFTQYYGQEVDFYQSSHASHCDETLIEGKLGYIGKIQDIMQVDFSSFQCVFFFSSSGIPSAI
jgi:hypothetical protein